MRIRVALLLFLPTVTSLQCHICGDSNLDEFGECSTQFPYACDTYAQRFSPDEKIYCRTTRHKAQNATYTVLKECISASDHYKKFPEKEVPLEEECDLVDIDGQEVAYCICRSGDLCNARPIAEQFMQFEQKHPELFASEESEETVDVRAAPPNNERSFDNGDNVAALGAPQIQPLPILPVNDPRFVKTPREKLPSREEEGNQEMKDMESAEIDALFRAREASRGGGGGNRETEPTIGRIDASVPAPPRPSGFVFSTNALDGSMISQKRFEQSPQIPSSPVQQIPRSEQFGVKQAPLPSPVLPVAPPSILKCAQCGQGMLPDEQTDCPMQNIVDCAGTDTLCFTRQIMIGPGQNAVEKMCVNAVVLQNEYGEAAVKGGCAEAHQGKVRYCVCNTNECNRDPILKQISSKSKQSAPVQPIVSSNERMESAEIPPRFSIQRMPEAPLIPIQPINQPETPTKPASVSSASQPLNKLQPVPELPKPIKPANVIDVSKNIITSSGEVSLHCTMCSEMENTDPTADCKNPVTVDCAKSNGDTDQNYCITKQTQLATGLYTLEKKCTSKEEFQTEFPEEKMESGCGSAFDGLVNFCICTGEICNKKTLFEQTQIYKEILDASDGKGLEESNDENEEDNLGNGNNLPRQEFGGFVQKGPVPDSIDIRSELDQLKEKERQSVDITGLPSDDLDARQREWAAKEAELAKSQSTVTLSLLILLFCALRLL